MTKIILHLLFLVLTLNAYGQEDLSFRKVILRNHETVLKNNDTIVGKGSNVLTIAAGSYTDTLIEAEYSIVGKRGKTVVYLVKGKGKEISLVEAGSYVRPKDVLIISIIKMRTSRHPVFFKPKNSLFMIHLE